MSPNHLFIRIGRGQRRKDSRTGGQRRRASRRQRRSRRRRDRMRSSCSQLKRSRFHTALSQNSKIKWTKTRCTYRGSPSIWPITTTYPKELSRTAPKRSSQLLAICGVVIKRWRLATSSWRTTIISGKPKEWRSPKDYPIKFRRARKISRRRMGKIRSRTSKIQRQSKPTSRTKA